VSHSVDDFLVRWHDRGQRTTQPNFLFRDDKVVGTQTDPASKSLNRLSARVEEWLLHQASLEEFLKNERTSWERCDCFFDTVCPLLLRQILSGEHSATTPCKLRKSADLKHILPLPLAEFFQFPPILNFEPWDHGVMRNRGRIDDPGPREQ